jgi:hypothetical protein
VSGDSHLLPHEFPERAVELGEHTFPRRSKRRAASTGTVNSRRAVGR